MRLFIDSTTRVFRGVAPDGALMLSDLLTVGTIESDITDDDWNNIYYPAFSASVSSGQDLVIDIFGGTSLVTHTPTVREQAITTLYNYQLLTSPTQPQDAAAIKSLITYLEITKQFGSLPVPVVSFLRAPIAQGRRRPTRPRSRPIIVSPGSPAQQPVVTRGAVRRNPPAGRPSRRVGG